ncbi:MMPL family transporter [Nocardia cyriacigeorgica]|uniref:MMPL family transporter n=1 Tax=Nocardia cyriacigeorgica TaxID=135487 RepID=UPI00189351D6|nr:MMPL family transporter [Nocardia cyriacigeorgica]MBF6082559.1 MMPL family transporter [Nocardia cyriacigeorgica]MBF6425329.1 MMPL family transporter [Nocardia cyriacigeorgica]BDT89804.1 putative membrane protein, MmpL [Nocardia cyriacigeorgica]
MFTRWGDLVYRLRFAVIGVVVAALLALGGYGLGLGDHLSNSGWDDPTSESAEAARISDSAYGRDHTSDVIVLYTAPEGKTIHDPEFSSKIIDSLNRLPREHPEQIAKVNGAYWPTETGPAQPSLFGSKDGKHTFASIAIVGDNDTEMVRNFRAVKDVFYIDGVDVQVAGLQAVAGTLNDTIASDSKRMEVLAIPAVAILLFFIFGGVVAAALPLIVGGLTVIGANGIVMALTNFTDVNSFVSNVVSMIGLGLAIDYGLFIVSRFREELAEGYDTPAAVRRTVMTAGRTVVFSATMIIASLGGMLLFPQGFLKSVAYGTIATVSLAALASITLLPAMLGILGPRVDMFGLKWFRKTKTAEEVENGFWGKSTRWVMKHPLKIAIPISILLLLLIIPVKNLQFGGINERYLPPDNPTRMAQQNFDEIFPLRKSDPVQLIMISENGNSVGKVWKQASEAPGLAGKFEVPSRSTERPDVYRTTATLVDSEDYRPTIEYLRAMDVPDDVTLLVGGQPAFTMDSIDALIDRMPLMIALVLFVTTLLMFLTFGSLVLPIKAALMSALGLGSTLGILTWIFVDGHGADLLNFTPQPIMSPVLVLIIAVVYGLSTDYEVFLLSRMVEARAQGASTTEAIRIGTANTGRIITAAALILLVVTGAFAFSDLVMMQYIAYGMIAALFIDATILRMLLVPATMKLLGDDCWWAPAWMKRIQQKIGLGEPILDDERPARGEVVDLVKTTPITDPVTMQMPAMPESQQRKTPRRPRTVEEIEAEAPTQRLDALPPEPNRPRGASSTQHIPMPVPPDPTRPRAAHATPPEPGEAGKSGSTLRLTPETPQVRGSERILPPRTVAPDAGAAGDEGAPVSETGVIGGSPGPVSRPSSESASGYPGATDSGRSAATGPSHSSATGPAHPAESASGPSAFGGHYGPADPTRPRPHPPEQPFAPFGETPGGPAESARPQHDPVGGGQIGGAPRDAESAGPGSHHAEPAAPLTSRAEPAGPPPGTAEAAGRYADSAPTHRAEPAAGDASATAFFRVPTPEPAQAPDRLPPLPESSTEPAPAPEPQEPPRPLLPRVSTPGASPAPDESSTTEVPAQQSDSTQAPEAEAGDDNRSSIENWMAELRSSRRRTPPPDQGRHHSGDGRTVSVNELLRRRDSE